MVATLNSQKLLILGGFTCNKREKTRLSDAVTIDVNTGVATKLYFRVKSQLNSDNADALKKSFSATNGNQNWLYKPQRVAAIARNSQNNDILVKYNAQSNSLTLKPLTIL